MFKTKFVEKLETQLVFSIFFFFFQKKNRSVYEIMWKIMVQSDRPQTTVQYDTEKDALSVTDN